MLEEMLFYHISILWVALMVLIWGALIPFIYEDKNKMLKALKLHIGIFHGAFLMMAFSGMIAMFFGKIEFNMSMLLMSLAWFFITFFEAKKYFTIHKILDGRKSGEIGDIKKTTLIFESLNLVVISAIVLLSMV